MTQILIPRGSAGSSSSPNQNRSSTMAVVLSPSSSSASPEQRVIMQLGEKTVDVQNDDVAGPINLIKGFGGLAGHLGDLQVGLVYRAGHHQLGRVYLHLGLIARVRDITSVMSRALALLPPKMMQRAKGLEVRKMVKDGNCLLRAVADQVYGKCGLYDLVRQMCIDYMVYGNIMEIQALSEMYNRPIHIYLYSYSLEPINVFHGSYNTDTPPIQISYHHGNHYNSLVDPRRLTIGAGLGFSSLQRVKQISRFVWQTNVDKDQVKAAIGAQQDRQVDNVNLSLWWALLAERHFYSELELTEKEIEHMVMAASRAEYLADDKFK
ncbi:hypothetical protein BUALT_BualtUnG0032700 [Buddleja alternifolia]|uniref:ubiquitinyl hydrolase 1 n=1 Tax=Buddleja alternifolia TaxID=168488 RepID=A0AAV6W0D7_9LAMI|nr:hypothetical protein BUALT_BualtUnG0032700 [Buddleja alternifolia]